MNRIIKFRAWDKEMEFMCSPMSVFGIGEFLSDDRDYELMQFTGLLDKNGVEIYEGDCLRSMENDEVYQVGSLVPMSRMAHHDYSTNIGYFEGKKYHHRSAGGAYHEDDWISNPEFYEVIGNIYENPTLLESNL